MSIHAIDIAIKDAGGLSALAGLLGISPATVAQWRNGSRPVPVILCVDIERVTNGAVTRQQLRPDDWIRIWPELSAEKVA